jgi:uroporphyrinogen decarboxylase
LILEPMGIDLEFAAGEGPVIHNPVRKPTDVDQLLEIEDVSALEFVNEAIRQTRRALRPDIPLIGFCGAPFTLASYVIEGGGSKNYVHTKRLMYDDRGAWHALLSLISRGLAKYLNAQIAAGAQAVQLFDSWIGCLGPDDYREFVLPHTQSVIRSVTPGVPVIHFGTGTAALLELMREAGGDVIGLDWRIPLDRGWDEVGDGHGVQGNLDPAVLLGPWERVQRAAQDVLDRAGNRPGHIFNLGHGVLPQTDPSMLGRLVELVREAGVEARV